MEELSTTWLIDIAYAVGIGLFVGLEREHHELTELSEAEASPAAPAARPPDLPILGMRTFALLSLLGWASGYASALWAWLPVAALVLVAAVLVAQYVLYPEHGGGLTTEVAAAVTFVAGLLVNESRSLAVVIGLATTLLLISKPWVRPLVTKVRRIELTATLQLAILLAIVLPLLPSEPVDPWDALPPRKIGLFIILIGGLGYVGYFLSRILGPRRGAGVTGMVGGLASSTAVTVSMAQEARAQEHMIVPGQLAVFLANGIMFARVLVVTAVISRTVALRLVAPLAVMGLVMVAAAGWRWLTLRRHESRGAVEHPPALKNPFALLPALKWGALIIVVLLLAELANRYFGERGLLAAAAASGLADVDAITLAVSRQSAGGALAASVAALAITIAVISNTVVKGGLAVVAGGRRFGTLVATVFTVAIVLGLGVAALQAYG